MKNLLILSYHALPMEVVSSYRTKGFCDYLVLFGIYPTLVTHRWEKDSDGNWKFHKKLENEIVIERTKDCTTIRLPRRSSRVHRNSKIQTFGNYFKGVFEAELTESYNIFREFLLDHLIIHKYDAILTIYSPHFQMKLANELKLKFGIPYITDFRDLWDNQIVTKSYKPALKKRFIDLMVSYWWKKWIKDAVFFSTTGESWKKWLEDMTGVKRGVVVRNGFDGEIYESANRPIQSDEFLICHFGRLYSDQDLSVFIRGFGSFIQREVKPKAKLLIIGHKPRYGVVVENLLRGLPANAWEVYPYMSKSALLNFCANNVSVFWMPGFYEDNGSFAVKVYDYLLLGKNILFAPGDGSEITNVLAESKTGVTCNTVDEVSNQLSVWYESFKVNGYVPYFGDDTVIWRYSRLNQVKILAAKIHEYLR